MSEKPWSPGATGRIRCRADQGALYLGCHFRKAAESRNDVEADAQTRDFFVVATLAVCSVTLQPEAVPSLPQQSHMKPSGYCSRISSVSMSLSDSFCGISSA